MIRQNKEMVYIDVFIREIIELQAGRSKKVLSAKDIWKPA